MYERAYEFCESCVEEEAFQVIPGNDENTTPTNQETAGSKLERTAYLTFYGSQRHLRSFSGGFLV